MKPVYATITMQVSIPGNQRYLDAELLIKQVAVALRGKELAAGQHEVCILGDGRIMLDGVIVYEPKKPQIAARGA